MVGKLPPVRLRNMNADLREVGSERVFLSMVFNDGLVLNLRVLLPHPLLLIYGRFSRPVQLRRKHSFRASTHLKAEM